MGTLQLPELQGEEEPRHEVKAYQPDMPTDEELSKSSIWLTTPMQQRSKNRRSLRLVKRHCVQRATTRESLAWVL